MFRKTPKSSLTNDLRPVLRSATGVVAPSRAPSTSCPAAQLAARNMRAARVRRGLSIGQVAGELGVDKVTISRWETAQRWPSVEHLWAYARSVGLDTGGLFTKDDARSTT